MIVIGATIQRRKLEFRWNEAPVPQPSHGQVLPMAGFFSRAEG
jgi:hypothetical protein